LKCGDLETAFDKLDLNDHFTGSDNDQISLEEFKRGCTLSLK